MRDDATRNYGGRIREATDRLTGAEVAVYPVDARGLKGAEFNQFAGEMGTMNLLAEQTGGRAFYNTNAIEQVLEIAAVDGSSYYSLLYAPTDPKFDGSVRHIKVTCKNGYRLAYRRTYFADDVNAKTPRLAPVEQDHPPAEPFASDEEFGAPLTYDLVFASARATKRQRPGLCGAIGRAPALSRSHVSARTPQASAERSTAGDAAVHHRLCGACQPVGYAA